MDIPVCRKFFGESANITRSKGMRVFPIGTCSGQFPDVVYCRIAADAMSGRIGVLSFTADAICQMVVDEPGGL